VVGYYRQKFRLWQIGLYFFLIYFATTDFHPQWFLWLMPFVVVDLVKNNMFYWQAWFLALTSWVLITLTFEASLNLGIFIPINSNLIYASNLSAY